MPNFSANLGFLFTELPFLDRFAAAARAGFKGVGICLALRARRARYRPAARRPRSDASAVQPAGRRLGGRRARNCSPARPRSGVPRRRLARSGLCGGTRLRAAQLPRRHSAAGRRSASPRGDLRRQPRLRRRGDARATRQAPDRADQHARHAGLLPEPQRRGLAAHATRRLRQSPSPSRHLPHAGDGGRSRAPPRSGDAAIAHIQIADNPGRHEPGSGEINYAFLLPLIDRLGYGGWVGCEYLPLTTTEAGLAWMAPYRDRGGESEDSSF